MIQLTLLFHKLRLQLSELSLLVTILQVPDFFSGFLDFSKKRIDSQRISLFSLRGNLICLLSLINKVSELGLSLLFDFIHVNQIFSELSNSLSHLFSLSCLCFDYFTSQIFLLPVLGSKLLFQNSHLIFQSLGNLFFRIPSFLNLFIGLGDDIMKNHDSLGIVSGFFHVLLFSRIKSQLQALKFFPHSVHFFLCDFFSGANCFKQVQVHLSQVFNL